MSRRSIRGMRTIVTGATSGIGRALVVELIGSGAKVVAVARRRDRLEQLATELAAPDRLRLVVGDVTTTDTRRDAIAMATQQFGGLDALVNNAGIGTLAPFLSGDASRLRQIMEVNFFAPAEFMREAIPELEKGVWPIIVNVASVLGHRAVPEKSEYCASKFALHGLSDALRLELAPRGIDLLLVSPSTTRTEFFDTAAHLTRDGRPAEGNQAYDGLHGPENLYRFGVMSAQTVARKTLRAMAAGRSEIILSLGGKTLVWLDRLWPEAADWFIGRWLQKGVDRGPKGGQ